MKSSLKLHFLTPFVLFLFIFFPSNTLASDQWILHFKNASDLEETKEFIIHTHEIIGSVNNSLLVSGEKPHHRLIEKIEVNYEKQAVKDEIPDPLIQNQWGLGAINQQNVHGLFPEKPGNLLKDNLIVINGNQELKNSSSFKASKIKIDMSELSLSRLSIELSAAQKWGFEARDDNGDLISLNEGTFKKLDLLLPHDLDTSYIELTLLNSQNIPSVFTIEELSGVDNPIVAVLDSGVTMHEDFCSNVLYSLSKDYTKEEMDWAIDTYGHGTHVTGILSACHDNGMGISGALGNTPIDILPMKVLNSRGAGSDFQISEALYDAIELKVSAINISIAGKGETLLLRDAILSAAKKNIPVIAAAGNYNSLTTDVYPASYPSVITVSGINQAFQKVNTSNFGWEVDISGPGFEVMSTYTSPLYKALNGTSMATPYVTGAAAILKHQYPEDLLIHTRERLFNSTRDIMTKGFDLQTGHGLVQYSPKDWAVQPEEKFEWVNYRDGQPLTLKELHHLTDRSLLQKDLLVYANGTEISKTKIKSNYQSIAINSFTKPTVKLFSVVLDGNRILHQSYLNLTQQNALSDSFTDVPTTHWAFKEISESNKLGIVNGYSDQSFKPNQSISRRHATMILNRLFQWDSLESMDSMFADINDFDFISRHSILSANKEKVINGYSSGEFKPENPLLRSQMALILYRALQIEDTTDSKDLKFSDVSSSDEFYQAVSSLTKAGIITNQDQFRPYDEITRAQFSAMISRSNQYLTQKKKETAQ
ncbi:S8 family peptidase [Jeotgalibacillus aurantiacus]|uniref:S8 family peptidase n=1 Tax=Jeotgalibacillus aurantiacus TaxID=2763266 RepID=UPI001D0BB45F|nr:S8 family serine peptidase [Jeotgalibacillus aurantiacus]